MEYKGFSELNGQLMFLDGVKNPVFDELVRIKADRGVYGEEQLIGRVIKISGGRVVVQVFGRTDGISNGNSVCAFTGRPMETGLSADILGRTFDGLGRVCDGRGDIFPVTRKDINGSAINPVKRVYPRNYIKTGISAIDGTATLIRGQKLPVFSGNGLPHDRLAAQIVRQASAEGEDGKNFAVVFAAIGVSRDTMDFFRQTFEESGALSRVVMYVNLASDPIAERLITPRLALTAAEYLAFEKNMHVLAVITDMTSYAEALREVSSSCGEIPGKKGYPGYLYSELASLFERAGIVEGSSGSVTQIPILTMPNDDITHPMPDLTGYITEGQIVLDRRLHLKGVYPPIAVLPSLSRLMKDGIGDKYTRRDHPALANQLTASYAKAEEAEALASVIGLEELSETDKKYIAYGKMFEERFIGQKKYENRSMEETLNIGWDCLRLLPKSELNRMPPEITEEFFQGEN
ncbi:MAG: V-type ATP synthase subunit B [Defluviitaleaceae bacterium]|nr:V-type ATP synthase subunit B [Defluviitaleaceae bacterium]